MPKRSICAHRPESPGSFTSCVVAIGGCLCSKDLQDQPEGDE